MNEALIAGRYTRALYNIAVEKNILEPVKNDMEYFYSVFRESEPLRAFFQNPVLKPQQKSRIFKQIFSSFNPVTLSLIDLVIKNRREEILSFIALDYITLYNKAKGIESVVIKTAVAISKDNLERIKQLLVQQLHKDIVISTVEDKSLIGGFILTISDKQIDASIRTELKRFEQNMVNSQIK
jgi:F-type H+-transporting ATPase subunit delta